MTRIEKNSDFVTLINLFTVDQSKQKILIDMLIEVYRTNYEKAGGLHISKYTT